MKNLLTYIAILLIAAGISLAEEMTVHKIVIKGNEHTKEYIIARELLTKVGEPADDEKLETDRNRLFNLGIFSDVWIDKVEEDGGYTVFVIVQERIAVIPFPLVDYNEEDGWSGGAGVIHRNLGGRNRTIGLYGTLGGKNQYYLAVFDPWITGERVSFQSEMSRSERIHPYEDFRQVEHTAWIELGKRWIYKYYGRIKTGWRQVSSDKPGITLTDVEHDNLPFLLFTGIYDGRDLWVNPSEGWLIHGRLGQYGIPNEAPDFRRFGMSVSRFIPVKFGRTLGLNVQFWEKNGEVPVYENYYIGGSGSIRGLAGNSYKGTRILLSSMEYRFDILKSRPILPKFDFGIGGAAFIDNGTVWNAGESAGDKRFYNGFGMGLRFFLPFIEVFRVDLAWTEDTSYRVVFNVGMKF